MLFTEESELRHQSEQDLIHQLRRLTVFTPQRDKHQTFGFNQSVLVTPTVFCLHNFISNTLLQFLAVVASVSIVFNAVHAVNTKFKSCSAQNKQKLQKRPLNRSFNRSPYDYTFIMNANASKNGLRLKSLEVAQKSHLDRTPVNSHLNHKT